MKPRVVFVDDEPELLAGMRDRLRRHRQAWDMLFFTSPREALADITAHGADVVISDVRMPEMNGAELLGKVREACRSATRVALSGQTDAETAMALHVVAHQFLSKPCDPSTLVEVIERRARLSLAVPRAALELVASAPEVPAAPLTYRELDALFSRDGWSLDEVLAVLERDAIAAMHLVRVASSPYFGGRRASSLKDAALLLGAKTVQRIVLGLEAAGAFANGNTTSAQRLAYAKHAELVAARVAERAPASRAGDAYVLGLLHDVGSLVMAATQPSLYQDIAREAEARAVAIEVVERERLGFDHAQAGAGLLAIWGLPCDLVEAVLLHHGEGGGELAEWLRAGDGPSRVNRFESHVGGAP